MSSRWPTTARQGPPRWRYCRAAIATALITLLAAPAGAPAFAQRPDTTGSHLGSLIPARTIANFDNASVIREVLELLESGRTDEAVALAGAHIENVESATHAGRSHAVHERYTALNTHCSALTKASRIEEAVASCRAAIELVPQRWTAVNNLGTAWYAIGDYEQAISAYQRALALASDDAVAAMIRNNLRLAQLRESESSPVEPESLR